MDPVFLDGQDPTIFGRSAYPSDILTEITYKKFKHEEAELNGNFQDSTETVWLFSSRGELDINGEDLHSHFSLTPIGSAGFLVN